MRHRTPILSPLLWTTSNSGRELTWGCYAVKQKYHLPCPPPPLLQFFGAYICTSK